ncbi:hypothetical protein [Myxococcus sp. RHSTA-1-4]|uniref:hypothetical protein n=1 Tax=Myxococcus sp. RHSTA-1-4 TaxID=2874601 RepID=UPI001CBC345C|nr:hypothetical protein [Myxococcus sp. RHSTA-1-4]MBZ4415136.1 hypothetical protein [Myxococcus sp. RHSTA-1-4]
MKNTSVRPSRGAVLLLVVVLLAVVTVLAMAAIGFSGSERGAASSFRSSEELVACADAGRQYLLSRFRLIGGSPTQLAPTDQRLDLAGLPGCNGATPTDDARCIRSGHLGEPPAISGVRLVPQATLGRRSSARDLTNVIAPASGLGGQTYQVVVHCVDGRGAQSEVEFTVRFGL